MITQSESGLTESQYLALFNAERKAAFRVTAHQYNLGFSSAFATPIPSLNTANFDSEVLGDTLVHVVGSNAYFYDTNMESPAPISIPSFDGATTPSITGSWIFVHTSTAIYRHAITETPSVGSQELVINDTGITKIAAVSATRVHYIVFNAASRTYQFKCAEYNGSWSIVASDIHLMYPVQSLDAETLNGKDVLAIVCQVPGLLATKTTGAKAEKYLEPSGGVLVFTYKYQTWSDHVAVDVVEKLSSSKFRRGVKLSVIRGKLFLTAFSFNGSAEYGFMFYRVYTSKDGKFWSLGNALSIQVGDYTYGLKLLARGDYIYGAQAGEISQAYSTLFTGYSPAEMQVDITDSIRDYNLSRDSMMQSEVTLANKNGVYDNHPIISLNNTIMLVHEVGYYVGSATSPTFITYGQTEVDYMEINPHPTKKVIKLVGRDQLSRLSDYSQSEEANYRENQLVGGDNYTDFSETNYGGMRFTAQQSGSWQTINNRLELRSSNTEGIAFNTFDPYIWNGNFQIDFALSTLANNEFAGIVFRALDPDNLLYAIYQDADDRVSLYIRVQANNVLLAQSEALGWANLNQHWMRVEFNYARIKVLVSDDGITWYQIISILQTGEHAAGTVGRILLDKGYVGAIGKGYSPDEVYTFPDFEFDTLFYMPFDFNFDFNFEQLWGDFTIDPDTAQTNPVYSYGRVAHLWTKDGEYTLTTSLNQSLPEWITITSPWGNVIYALFDKFSEYVTTGGISGQLGCFILVAIDEDFRFYYTADLLAETISWTQKHSGSLPSNVVAGKILQNTNSTHLGFAVRCENGSRSYISTNFGTGWVDYDKIPSPLEVDPMLDGGDRQEFTFTTTEHGLAFFNGIVSSHPEYLTETYNGSWIPTNEPEGLSPTLFYKNYPHFQYIDGKYYMSMRRTYYSPRTLRRYLPYSSVATNGPAPFVNIDDEFLKTDVQMNYANSRVNIGGVLDDIDDPSFIDATALNGESKYLRVKWRIKRPVKVVTDRINDFFTGQGIHIVSATGTAQATFKITYADRSTFIQTSVADLSTWDWASNNPVTYNPALVANKYDLPDRSDVVEVESSIELINFVVTADDGLGTPSLVLHVYPIEISILEDSDIWLLDTNWVKRSPDYITRNSYMPPISLMGTKPAGASVVQLAALGTYNAVNALFRDTSHSGTRWRGSFVNPRYTGAYMNPHGAVYGFGSEILDQVTPDRRGKLGNLLTLINGEIWGMETL